MESYNLAYKTQSELHDDIKFITEDIILAWMTREILTSITLCLSTVATTKVISRVCLTKSLHLHVYEFEVRMLVSYLLDYGCICEMKL